MSDHNQNIDSKETKLSDFEDADKTAMTDGGTTDDGPSDEELMGGSCYAGPDTLVFDEDDQEIDKLAKTAYAIKGKTRSLTKTAMSMREGNAVYEIKYKNPNINIATSIEVVDSGSRYNLHARSQDGKRETEQFGSFEAALRDLYQMYVNFDDKDYDWE